MAYTDAERAEAVALCVEIGMKAAHERLDIPKATMSRWMTPEQREQMAERFRSKTSAATEAHALAWAERRGPLTDKLGRVAELAVDKALELIEVGKLRDAKDAMVTAAVGIDKAQLLSGDATSIVKTPWDPERVKAYADEEGEKVRPLRAVG